MKKNKKESPTCIGIIMDGNRRWAKKHKLHVSLGHIAGRKKLKECILWSKEVGIKNVIVYAFSTENWERSKKEIDLLMDIFRKILKDADSFKKENIRIKFAGQKERFPEDIRDGIKDLETATKKCNSVNLCIALSYGGRAEIISAVNTVLKKKIKNISEKTFSDYLWTAGIPDPDIIIRTGGEKRLSNFLTWQSVYSELFFVDTYWPAFSKREFKGILKEYMSREIRKGK